MTTLADQNGKVSTVRRYASRESISEMQEFICGWGAAFINISVTFPLNKVMFRQVRAFLLSIVSCDDECL